MIYKVPLAQVHGELRMQRGHREDWVGGWQGFRALRSGCPDPGLPRLGYLKEFLLVSSQWGWKRRVVGFAGLANLEAF